MIEDRFYMRGAARHQSPWSTSLILVVANTAVYALQLIFKLIYDSNSSPIERYFALNPQDWLGWIYQVFTFQFLHSANPLHLVLNCAMLYMFGRPVEMALGRKEFLKLYLVSGALGGLAQIGCSWLFPGHFGMGSVVGASAGVFALLAAFAALNWDASITTLLAFIIPVTMRAKYLILIMGILAVFGMLEKGSRVAHAAHLGGLLAGLAYIRLIIQADRTLFDWRRFRHSRPRPELVEARSSKRSFWQKPQSTPNSNEDLPPAEFISREVDPILDKISAHGIQSLTDRERKILEAARAKMAKR
jgi:membrane associated rhomboid family serine protease